jgi:Ca-activated chloride channel family protein
MEGIELTGSGREQLIALRGVRVRARLSGMCQKSVVEQMFVNLEPRAIEAVYTFPLPEGAAVCGFEVITGDRVLTGTIEENEKAIEQYDQAIDQGHGAFMVEADRPDVFTARVGNLKARQSATIRLTYVAPLERVDKQIRVTFPTTVAPRFASVTGMDPLEGMIDGDALNPPKALQVPYGLTLEVDVDLGKKINSITSPTHAVRVTTCDGENLSPSPGTPGEGRGEGSSSTRNRSTSERGPHPNLLPEYRERGLRVLLDGAITKMDRDIVLDIELAREHEPSAEVGLGPDGAAYVAVTFVPEFEIDQLTSPQPSETIFVLDCSGSMQGESIDQATRALELCLRALSPGDTFNICRFGSTFEMMSSEPLVYSQQTLVSALKYMDQRADLGGTEILPALQAIFGTNPRAGETRNIIVLTDGQVSNEPAVIALARKHRERNRIFSFGIGSASSAFLVRGLARATRGASEFISGKERIEDKVLRTFSRITSPMIEQVEIDWGGADVQTLAEIPPIFDGDVMTVFGRVQGTPPPSVQLKCMAHGKPKNWQVALSRPHDDGGVIATMWARRTIQSLEEVNDVRRAPHEDKQNRERRLIIDISKQFNLVSSLTTFIAIEHRSIEDRNEGRPALRRVPVALAAEWGGGKLCDSTALGAVTMACLAAEVPIARRSDRTLDRTIDRLRDTAPAPEGKLRRAMRSFVGSMIPRAGAPAETSKTARDDELQSLLALQSADGWFDSDDQLISKLVTNWREWQRQVEAALPKLGVHAADERLGRTAIILLALRTQFGSREPLWRRAAQKALHWIAHTTHLQSTEVRIWLDRLETQTANIK